MHPVYEVGDAIGVGIRIDAVAQVKDMADAFLASIQYLGDLFIQYIVKNLISKYPQLMGIELEEKAPMEVIIKMTKTGAVYKSTKTGLHYHKVKYIKIISSFGKVNSNGKVNSKFSHHLYLVNTVEYTYHKHLHSFSGVASCSRRIVLNHSRQVFHHYHHRSHIDCQYHLYRYLSSKD